MARFGRGFPFNRLFLRRVVIPPPTVANYYVDAASATGGDGTTSATAGANRAFHSLAEAFSALASTSWSAINQRPVINCGGSTADTVPCTGMPAGWTDTTSPACYLTIQGNQPNALQVSTSHYRLDVTAAGIALELGIIKYVRVYDLAVLHAGMTDFGAYTIFIGGHASPASCRFERVQCRAIGVSGSWNGDGAFGLSHLHAGAFSVVVNCVAVGYTGGGAAMKGFDTSLASHPYFLYNCTAVDCHHGFAGPGSTTTVKNCGATGIHASGDGFNGTFNSASDYNASGQADAPGANSEQSVTPTFVNAAGGNYHLSPSDTAWKDQGNSLAADGTYPFATDGDNAPRTGTWDIGADEAPLAYTLDASAGSYTTTGGAATVRATRKLTAEAGSYTVTGAAATLIARRHLVASAGSYTVTGAAATATATRRLDASAGSYATTGAIAALVAGRSVNAAPGSYSTTGQPATLTAVRVITATAGTYTVTGADASLKPTRLLIAAAGAYAVTGANAELIPPVVGYQLAADAGSYAVNGADATVTATRRMTAEAGTYAFAGSDAALAASRSVVAEPGAYAVTGSDAALTLATGAYVLNAEPGAYVVTGADAFLRAIQTGTGGAGTGPAGIIGIVIEGPPREAEREAPEEEEPEPEAPRALVLVAEAGAYRGTGADVTFIAPPSAIAAPGVAPEPTKRERLTVAEVAAVELVTDQAEPDAAALEMEPLSPVELRQLEIAEAEEAAPEPEPTEAEPFARALELAEAAELIEPTEEEEPPEALGAEVAPIEPSPTVTIQAATPAEAAAKLIEQIQAEGVTLYTGDDMMALTIALAEALA